MANPMLILGGLSAAGSVYNWIQPNEAQEIQRSVLRDMQARRQRLNRQARGKFTGQEQQSIMGAAEPGLNRLSGNLAQRGLGTSPAGGQLMAQASVQPFVSARQFADQQLGVANAQALDASQLLAADDSFFDDIEGIAQGYFELEGLNAAQDDGLLNSVLALLNQMGMGQSGGGMPGGGTPGGGTPGGTGQVQGPQADPKVFQQFVDRPLMLR